MKLPANKTKIVCTIGPSSCSPDVIEALIDAGMNVARINLSHGNPEEWTLFIENIRKAEKKKQRMVEIFVDLPGAKIRVGTLTGEPLLLKKDDTVTFFTGETTAEHGGIPIEYPLADSVAPGAKIFLDDGFIELHVREVTGDTVRCAVVTGGALTSHKGVNLPGAKLSIEPVTGRDLELVAFALDHGVETIGISFVTGAKDILKVKDFAQRRGRQIFAIAKIELGSAVDTIDDILNVADGIMIARGDLGVEMPIEEVPSIQKKIIAKANLMGRPVITATQMLESMKDHTRPTRAEVSDVANAIFDGTDAVMLSEETAVGEYPVEAVRMMAAIAVSAEAQRRTMTNAQDVLRWYLKALAEKGKLTVPDVVSRNAVIAADVLNARYIVTPTETGGTPRRVARYKPEAWVLAFSSQMLPLRRLALSYGVFPFLFATQRDGSWHVPMVRFLNERGLIDRHDQVIICEGGFTPHPAGTDSIEIVTVGEDMLAYHQR